MISPLSDLSTEAIARIESRMRPGGLLPTGFLREGERLLDVIRRDSAALGRLGVRHETIANGLENLLVKAHRRIERIEHGEEDARAGEYPKSDSVVIEGRYRVYGFGVHMRGSWPCPFEAADGRRCPGYDRSLEFRNQSFTIVNQTRQMALGFSVFSIHLIREHHFFEGDVEYRIDPHRAATVLDLCD